jgi:RNA polymerase sigma factor for flagellar operon FliA
MLYCDRLRGIRSYKGVGMLEELWRRHKYEKDSHAREELITKCLPLVKFMAQGLSVYSSTCCDAEDLVSAGIIGLMDALEKYDPSEQTSLRTYAKCRIRGAMLDEIRNLKWAPRSIQEKIRTLKNVYTRLEQVLSRSPNEDELSDALDMSIEQFHKMMIQIGPSAIFTCSTKTTDDEEEEGYLETHFEDLDAISPEEQVIYDETKSILASAIKALPEKEAFVISLYYYDEMTMKEIGEVLSLTESRICQIHSKALYRLFQTLNSSVEIQESLNFNQAYAVR